MRGRARPDHIADVAKMVAGDRRVWYSRSAEVTRYEGIFDARRWSSTTEYPCGGQRPPDHRAGMPSPVTSAVASVVVGRPLSCRLPRIGVPI